MMDYYKGDKPWSKTEKITMIGKVHRIFGYIMLFIGNLACGLGTENYVVNFMHRPDLIPSGFISLGIFCALILLMEIVHRIVSRKSFMIIKTPEAGTKIRAKKTIKFYTPRELEKAVEDGEPLVVLDNLILSMVGADEFYPGYEKIHPGGKFLITRNYGRDISKFFYGGYVMING